MVAVSKERWLEAQQAEREYWLNVGFWRFRQSMDGSMRTAIWAGKLLEEAPGDWLDNGVGPLGVGCTQFLGCTGDLHILDPIARVPADDWQLPEPLKAFVRYCHEASSAHVGQAEQLPFADDAFSLVAMENMLDHVEDPARALQEARRVLAPGGQLLLAVDTFSVLGEARFRLKAPLKANSKSTFRQAHPHRFSSRSLQQSVKSAGFEIVHIDTSTPLRSVLGRGYFTRMIAR